MQNKISEQRKVERAIYTGKAAYNFKLFSQAREKKGGRKKDVYSYTRILCKLDERFINSVIFYPLLSTLSRYFDF